MSTITKAIRIDVDAKAVEDLQSEFAGVSQEVKDVNSQLKKLDQQIKQSNDPQEVEQLTREYKALEKELNKVEKEYKDVDKAQDKATQTSEEFANSQVETAENAFKVGEGLVGVFTLVSLASSESQEDTEALLAEVLQLVVILDSVKKSAEGLRGAFKLASTASKNFGKTTKRALAATGIGLLVLAIGGLVLAFDQLSDVAEEDSEKVGGSLSLIKEAVISVKAAFETAKSLIIENLKAIGIAILFILTGPLGLLAGAIIKIGTSIKNAFDEGFTGVEAFKKGLFDAVDDMKEELNSLGESITGVGDKFDEEKRKLLLEEQLKNLDEAIKLTNGLASSNANLRKQQAGAQEDIKARIALEREALNIQEDAIRKELTRFGLAESFRKLTSEELIRQNELNNQLIALGLERADLTKQLIEEEEKTRGEAIQKQLNEIEELAEFRRLTLEATVEDENELTKELLQVEEERNQARLDLFKASGEEFKKEAIKEELELVKAQNEIRDNQKEENQRRNEKELADLEKIFEDQKKAFEKALADNSSLLDERSRDLREARNNDLITEEEFAEKSLDYQEDALKREIELRKSFGQETFKLESQLLDLQQKRREEQLNKEKEQRQEIVNSLTEAFKAITDLAFTLQEAQIAKLDQLIQASQGKIDELNNTLANTQSDREQIESDIDETKGKQREANATLDKELREQLNAQRQERKRLLDLEKQQAKEAEKAQEEQAKLEEEKAEREKRLAKQQANVALALALVESAPALVKALQAPFPLNIVQFGVVSTLLASTIAKSRQASQTFAKGGLLQGASHANGGIQGTGAFNNVEVEGGEFIVNKDATARNLPLLSAINEGKTTFASGGVLQPTTQALESTDSGSEVMELAKTVQKLATRPVKVGVTDIVDGINNVSTIDDASQIA